MRNTVCVWGRLVCAMALAVMHLPAVAAGPPPVEAYGELPAFEDAALSPDGQHIAIVATIKGQRLLLFLDSSMAVENTAQVGDLKVRGLEWVGDDSVLLTTSKTEKLGPDFTADKYESVRSAIIPRAPAGEAQMVFAKDRSIVSSVFGEYGIRQVSGTWFGYFGGVALGHSMDAGNYLQTTQPSLFAVALPRNEAKKIADPALEDHWRDWLVGADGSVSATFDMDEKSGGWTISGPRRKTIASGTNASGGAGFVSLGKDGTSVVYEASDVENISHWYDVPLDGSTAPVEFAKNEDVEDIFRSKTDGRMIGYLRGGAKPQRIFFDPRVQALSDKIGRAFPGLDITLEDWTPDFGRVLVRTSGTGDSGTWYLVDLTKMKADAIGVERPQVPREEVGPVSSFSYKAADGLEMDGILTLPPGRTPQSLPVVLLPHGGPAAHDKVQFDWWAQAFASRGYAVIQPNFRGSDNAGQEFERAGDGQWGRKMQSDISDALKALATQGIVDPSRACIVGASYGGYAALAGVTLQNGIYRCAVSVAGVSDISLMYKTDYRESGDVSVVRQSLLQQLGPRSEWDDVSPIHFAKHADAPILLIHGRDDTVVSFNQSTKMADALKDAGKPYEFVELKSEDHWLSRSDTREQMLAAALAFVQKYNPTK